VVTDEPSVPPFESLDFVYMPSPDVAADRDFLVDVLGGRPIFAVEGMGTRVAMVALADGPPRVLVAGHLDGERPVLVYRVPDLSQAERALEGRGWKAEHRLEIPHGPVTTFGLPGGQRLAIYEARRPDAESFFAGRHDF
jgi:pimeloyl-ACP methyl ester carboxylesterase